MKNRIKNFCVLSCICLLMSFIGHWLSDVFNTSFLFGAGFFAGAIYYDGYIHNNYFK